MEQNALNSETWFDDGYWDAADNYNKAYIEEVAKHLDNGTPAPDASHIRLEGRRRVDLIRFGLYGGVNNYNWQWKGGSYGGTNFSADLNIYAIPSNEISTNSNLKQNQGYN